MKYLLVVTTVLFGALFLLPKPAAAWVINVDCQLNTLPPPTRPYQNADCSYSFNNSANPATTQGEWTVTATSDPGGVGLDQIVTPQFSFSSQTSPMSTWIECSSYTGGVRMQMTGWSYRLVLPCSTCDTYWSVVDLRNDAAFPYISTPVACP